MKAEAYCQNPDLCFEIPEGFLLIDKSVSDSVAKTMKEISPDSNIGLYADLYKTFYQNKLNPADRAYITQLEKSGFLFLVFQKMTLEQKKKFPKEVFTKNSWPNEKVSQKKLEQSMMDGLRESKNLSSGGISINLIEFSSSKKYMIIKRTLDVTSEKIEQMEKAGIPMAQPDKVISDLIEFKFGQKEATIIMLVLDSQEENVSKYLHILKNIIP